MYWILSDIAVHCSISVLQTLQRGNNGHVTTSTLTFRIEPALKEALRAAAEKEHRFHRQHGGSVDPGLLRAQQHNDPEAGGAVS